MTIRIALIALAVLYALSPYDFVPDFLAGWGWLDDLVILGLLWRDLRGRAQKQFTFRGPYQRAAGPTERDAVKDPYTILGIGKGATEEEIKKAYRKLANKYHPDKVNHLGEEYQKLSEKRFIEIQEAYRILKKKN